MALCTVVRGRGLVLLLLPLLPPPPPLPLLLLLPPPLPRLRKNNVTNKILN